MIQKKRNINVSITPITLFWVVAIFLGFKFLSGITDVLIVLFISFLVAIGINPLVARLEKKRIPRSVSGIFIIALLFSALGALIASFAKPLTSQVQVFLESFPQIINKVVPSDLGLGKISFNDITPAFAVSDHVIRIAAGTFSGVFNLITMLIISYYLIQDIPKIKKYFKTGFPKKKDLYYNIFSQVELKLGSWVRGMLILMLAVGLLSYLGYSLIGLPFAVALGVIAAILEIIPSIGPFLTSVVSIIVGLAVSPAHALGAFIVGVLVQQLENNLLVPKVMQKTTGINPIVTILSIIIGLRLGGPILAIISLPIVLTLQVILSHLHLKKEGELPSID